MKSSIINLTVDQQNEPTGSTTHMVTVSCNKATGSIHFDPETVKVKPGGKVRYQNDLTFTLTLKFPNNTDYTDTSTLVIKSGKYKMLKIESSAKTNKSHNYDYLPTSCKKGHASTPPGHQDPDLDHPVIIVD